MERDYEKILEIIKKRKELEKKVIEENEEFLKNISDHINSVNILKSERKKELENFDEIYRDDIKKYDEFYLNLSKKIVDKIDNMELNTRNSFAELTKEIIIENLNNDYSKMFDIFNKTLKYIENKEYYLDYLKYDDLDVGLPYLLEFIKLNKLDYINDKDEETNIGLPDICNYIAKKMVLLIDEMPIGTADVFHNILKSNILYLAEIDMLYLMKHIYDCLKYRNYYLNFNTHIKKGIKWYIENKPYLTFIKTDDPVENYIVKTKELENKNILFSEQQKTISENSEKYKEKLTTMPKEEFLNEFKKNIDEWQKINEELNQSLENLKKIDFYPPQRIIHKEREIITFNLKENSTFKLGESRFFSDTIDLPDDIEMPKGLEFVGQINLSEIIKYDALNLLPKKGMLYFFQSPLEIAGHHYEFGKVIYSENMDLKRKQIEVNESNEFLIRNFSLENINKSTEKFQDRYCEYDGCVEYDYFKGEELNKIYGFYSSCQMDDDEIMKVSEKYIILLQLGSDIYGEGVTTFMISEDDLRNKNFDNIIFTYVQS